MNWLNSVLILLAAFVTVFLETWFDPLRNWIGVQIDLLPALIVYASLSSGLVVLALVSIVGGLCFDSLSANPLGITILPLFWVGLTLHQTRALILREQKFAQCVLGASACAAVPALTFLLLITLRLNPLFGWGSLGQWVVMALVGGLMTPVIFRIFQGLGVMFNYQPVLPSSFRTDRELKRGR